MMYHQVKSEINGMGDDYNMTQPSNSITGFNNLMMQNNEEYNDSFEDKQAKAVHQCSECDKIFVSYKGLMQHAVIHTDLKPFSCDICSKSFRFKSNLFEHRSVHSGYTPHSCPYCGKTCRLKGNLKKHLKTHVNSKAELEEVWKPFSSNRRPPQEVPADAVIVRGNVEPMFSLPSKPRKKKLGLGDVKVWTDKIQNGEIVKPPNMSEMGTHFINFMENNLGKTVSVRDLIEAAKFTSFENFDCPLCKRMFHSKYECLIHLEEAHNYKKRPDYNYFCEICIKTFIDQKSYDLHQSCHDRVRSLFESGDVHTAHQPQLLEPALVGRDDVNGSQEQENRHDIKMESDS